MEKLMTLFMVFFLCGCVSNPTVDETASNDLNEELNSANKIIKSLEKQMDDKDELISTLRDRCETLESDIGILELEMKKLEEDSCEEFVSQNDFTDVVAGISNGFILKSFVPRSYNAYQSLSIIGYGETNDFVHELVDLTVDESPTMMFEVTGELYDFQIQIVEWNEECNDYKIIEILCSYKVICDADIVYNSVLAEGLPNELLTWKDPEGKEFYYLIGDIGRGDTSPTILISEYAELTPWWRE